MRNSIELIDYIMKICRERDITQQEFADKFNIPKSTMSRYVNHSRKFPVNLLGEVSEWLNIPLIELLDLQPVEKFSHLSTAMDIYISSGTLKSMDDFKGKIKDKVIEALEKDLQLLLQDHK